jgi:hypothetical protein
MRALPAWTLTIVQWRWAPFFALVVGALFINLFIAIIVPSRIETDGKSAPAANVLTRPGLSDDDEESTPTPFGALGNTVPRSPTPRSLPGFNAQGGAFAPVAPPPPIALPPPAEPPPPPAPPPPPVAAPPPPEPPPPAPPPPDPAAQQRMMGIPLRGVQPAGEGPAEPAEPPHGEQPQSAPPAPPAPAQ